MSRRITYEQPHVNNVVTRYGGKRFPGSGSRVKGFTISAGCRRQSATNLLRNCAQIYAFLANRKEQFFTIPTFVFLLHWLRYENKVIGSSVWL